MTHIIDLTNAPTPPRWFEFLLEPGKLQQHLEEKSCDPSPSQLIELFFRNIPVLQVESHIPIQRNATPSTNLTASNGNGTTNNTDEQNVLNEVAEKLLDYPDSAEVHIPPDSYEAKYRAKKAYALQILAIKVASFLKWDLDIICNNLSIPTQHKLIQALMTSCVSDECPIEVQRFAKILYYDWFLRSAITYQISTLQPQTNNTTIIYLSQLQQQQQAADSTALLNMGELFTPKSKILKKCSTELHNFISELTINTDQSAKKMKTSQHPFKKAKLSRPKMEMFDSRDEKFHDWTLCEPVESKDFLEAACYDLGKSFFFEESYELARESFETIKDSAGKFAHLKEYLDSATKLSCGVTQQNGEVFEEQMIDLNPNNRLKNERRDTKNYLIACLQEFKQSRGNDQVIDIEEGEIEDDDEMEEDSDLRLEQQNQHRLPVNSAWNSRTPASIQQQQLLEAGKGDVYMSQGNFKQAMGCFVGALMLMTDYFSFFSKNYIDEEPYISRMIQCSISLSCFTQAVALCQMTRSLNYTIAFKQLNERICNDCCDDIYECIWNVTLLEYIINMHSKRGEVERRAKVIQLLGQLELNENNPEDILREAERVRRGRFFRIMSNKYL